jgi:hypothetical protein
MDWHFYLNTLIHWAHKKNYIVDLRKNGDDSICDISKTIEINSSLPIQTQVIRLLHECGHVLIFENGSHFKFNQRNDSEDSDAYKVFTLVEEIEAWKRAKNLAEKLIIPISEDEWEKSMVTALKKYIDWASKGDELDEN